MALTLAALGPSTTNSQCTSFNPFGPIISTRRPARACNSDCATNIILSKLNYNTVFCNLYYLRLPTEEGG